MNALNKLYEKLEFSAENFLRMASLCAVDREVGEACPYCGEGKLVSRYISGEWFLGCSNFPKCAFSCDVKKEVSL